LRERQTRPAEYLSLQRTDTTRPCITESGTAFKRRGRGMEPFLPDRGFQVDPKFATLFSTSR
jgi:hypothetical protein